MLRLIALACVLMLGGIFLANIVQQRMTQLRVPPNAWTAKLETLKTLDGRVYGASASSGPKLTAARNAVIEECNWAPWTESGTSIDEGQVRSLCAAYGVNIPTPGPTPTALTP